MKILIKISTVLLIALTLMSIQAGSAMARQNDQRGFNDEANDAVLLCTERGGELFDSYDRNGKLESRTCVTAGGRVFTCDFTSGLNCYEEHYKKPPATGPVWNGSGLSTLPGSRQVGEINPGGSRPTGNLSILPDSRPTGNLSILPDSRPTGNLSILPDSGSRNNWGISSNSAGKKYKAPGRTIRMKAPRHNSVRKIQKNRVRALMRNKR